MAWLFSRGLFRLLGRLVVPSLQQLADLVFHVFYALAQILNHLVLDHPKDQLWNGGPLRLRGFYAHPISGETSKRGDDMGEAG